MNRLFFAVLFVLAASLAAWAEPNPTADEALAKARAKYPTALCVVSGEHLQAGEIVEYHYQQPGQPDRLVRLCCHKCVAKFKADPAKYLKKLDEATAAAGKKS
jgi:hypothetical protein